MNICVKGEGVFECFNRGSCLSPDTCSCRDGFGGFDCAVPLCRHEQVTGDVVGCQNGGICIAKDECQCIQQLSILSKAERGFTGWTGTDCSMPMCIQGFLTLSAMFLLHQGKKVAIVVLMVAYVYPQICANVLMDGAATIVAPLSVK